MDIFLEAPDQERVKGPAQSAPCGNKPRLMGGFAEQGMEFHVQPREFLGGGGGIERGDVVLEGSKVGGGMFGGSKAGGTALNLAAGVSDLLGVGRDKCARSECAAGRLKDEAVALEMEEGFPDGDTADAERGGELGFAEWCEWGELAVEDLASEFVEDLGGEGGLEDGRKERLGHAPCILYTGNACQALSCIPAQGLLSGRPRLYPRTSQPLQCQPLNLPDPFPAHAEPHPDLFQRLRRFRSQPKPKLQNRALAFCQSPEC